MLDKTDHTEWEQGDCFWKSDDLTRRGHGQINLEWNESDSSFEAILEEFPGYCVISQTCDIVRKVGDRPFIHIAPLVKLSDDDFQNFRKGSSPRYVYLGEVEEKNLMVDLDYVTTVSKKILCTVERVQGVRTCQERFVFARAVARKFERFAFPDGFNQKVTDFVKFLKKKHGKSNPVGVLLSKVKEIRVDADPDWNSSHKSITFYFFVESDTDCSNAKEVTNKLPKENSEYAFSVSFCTYDDLTAGEYLASVPLDLDYLSHSQK